MYFVTSDGDSYDIVYRGGPYPDGHRTTYEDSFTLPDGCYNLIWVDTYGDGSNDSEYGIGEITLDFGGTRQVAFADMSGESEIFRFGSCGGATAAPMWAPVSAPTVASADDECSPHQSAAPSTSSPHQSAVPSNAPNQADVPSTCGAGESLLQLRMSTDEWSLIENYLYLADVTNDEYIWNMPVFSLEFNSEYEGETCLQDLAVTCYTFAFFDEAGDGFLQGGLVLSLDGVIVLQIAPFEQGDVYEEGSPTTYWYQEFGRC